MKEGKLHFKEIKFALIEDFKLKCCVQITKERENLRKGNNFME